MLGWVGLVGSLAPPLNLPPAFKILPPAFIILIGGGRISGGDRLPNHNKM
jgi:hypothetical protein